MYRFCWLSIIAGMLLLQLSACAPLNSPDLPSGIEVQVLGQQPGARLLSWSPNGRWLAVAGQGLDLYDPARAIRRHLLDQHVSVVAWHNDNEELDVAVGDGFSSSIERIRVDGQKVLTFDLDDGYVADLLRADDRMLVVEARLKVYRFGGALKLLLRDLEAPGVKDQTLYENTLPPKTAAFLEKNPDLLGGAHLSPAGDMLAFFQFKDPPAFPASQQLMVRHLASGRQWPVANLSPPAGRPSFSADGESLWVIDGRGVLWSVSAWEKEMKAAGPGEGQPIAVSVAGDLVFQAGKLVQPGKSIDLEIQVDAAAFDPSAGRLAWIRSDQVEVVRGWQAQPEKNRDSKIAARLKILRDWRARGLVDADEYRAQRQGILNR